MSEKYKVRDSERAYFMTLTVIDWVDVFAKENNRQVIIESLKFCQQSKELEFFAWCLMSNHLHLIARVNGRNTLPDVIRDFKKFTAKKIISLIKIDSDGRREWMLDRFRLAADRIRRVKKYKFWQDGFHPIELYGNKVVKQKLLYVHNNPVKAQIVEYPEDYWYSSARNYSE